MKRRQYLLPEWIESMDEGSLGKIVVMLCVSEGFGFGNVVEIANVDVGVVVDVIAQVAVGSVVVEEIEQSAVRIGQSEHGKVDSVNLLRK